MPDIVVIGGGIVGASAAYHAARLGADVVLVDRGHAGQATAAGAGIVAPGTRERDGAEAELAELAARYYPRLIASLAEDGVAGGAAEEVGALVVARSEDEAERLGQVRENAERLRDKSIPFIGEVSLLSDQEARELFPALGPIEAALYQSRAMRVNGRVLRDSLVSGAERHGATVLRGEARLANEHAGKVAVEVGGEVVGAPAVILAAGAWTPSLAGELVWELPIFPQKGQIVHLEMRDAVTSEWPIVLGFQSHYLLTFPERRVVIGATRESGSGFDVRVTAAGVSEVLDQGLALAPGLTDAEIGEIRVGLRPATPDGLPLLGQIPGTESVYVAAGHGPSGLHFGPYSGAAIVDLALGRDDGKMLRPFTPGRFRAP